MSKRTRKAPRPPQAKHIIPQPPRADSLAALGATPPKVAAAEASYLDGLRADDLLDGLIGSSNGYTGGGWQNPVTGHGTFGRDKVMQGSFNEPYRISDSELSALYNGNDLAKRIVETIPKEMLRRGWRLVIPQDEPEAQLWSGAGDDDEAAQAAAGASGLEQDQRFADHREVIGQNWRR